MHGKVKHIKWFIFSCGVFEYNIRSIAINKRKLSEYSKILLLVVHNFNVGLDNFKFLILS